jgi:hypothetical protein
MIGASRALLAATDRGEDEDHRRRALVFHPVRLRAKFGEGLTGADLFGRAVVVRLVSTLEKRANALEHVPFLRNRAML